MNASFHALLTEQLPRFRRLMSWKGRQAGLQRADVDDLCQKALFKALRAGESFDLGRPLWPWLKRIGLNVLRDRLDALGRERARLVSLDARDGQGNLLYEAAAPSSGGEEGSEAAAALAGVMAGLRPEHRRVVGLLLDGKGNREIAALAGLNASTVGTIVCRFRKKLRAAAS